MAKKGEQIPLSGEMSDSWENERHLRETGDSRWMAMRSRLSARVGFEPTLTEQHHKDACDINFLMARYEKAGEVPKDTEGRMWFGDFTNIPDRFAARAALDQAKDSFMQLPAKARARFDNDPLNFLEYMDSNPDVDELKFLGLTDVKASSLAPAAPSDVPPVPSPAPSKDSPK